MKRSYVVNGSARRSDKTVTETKTVMSRVAEKQRNAATRLQDRANYERLCKATSDLLKEGCNEITY